MLNKNLFKKLTEKMEINKIVNEEVSEEEKTYVEQKVIFEGINVERINNLNIENDLESLEEK